MPNLSSLATARATTSATYAGETISLTYNPDKLTPRLLATMSAAGDGTTQVAALVDVLTSLISAWDLTGDDGSVLLPAATMPDLPLPLLGRLVEAISADIQPGN